MNLAGRLGYRLLPWQVELLDVALELVEDADGTFRYAYGTVVVHVPRRAGKSLLANALMLAHMVRHRRFRAIYAAQSGIDAVAAWRELWGDIEAAGLDAVFSRRGTAGSEAVLCKPTSSQASFLPLHRRTGHGRASDLIILDEAWAYADERGAEIEQGLLPTQATRPSPQLWVVSAAGDLRSTWFRKWLDRAREAHSLDSGSGIALVEYGAPDGPYDDPATWFRAHPALGHLIRPEFLAGELVRLGAADFERAYLARWMTNVARVIDADVWNKLTAVRTTIPRDAVVSFGLDVSLDRSESSIVAAWHDPSTNRVLVEVVDHRAGTDWLAPRMKELVDKHRPTSTTADGVGPSASVVAEVVGLGVPVVALKTAEYAAACLRFEDLVKSGRLRHRGEYALDFAVASAAKRPAGDGAFMWGRKASAANISALVAATCASWGATNVVKRPTWDIY